MSWIKCSDQPPETAKKVLLYDTKEGMCVGYRSNDYPEASNVLSFTLSQLGASEGGLFFVTHWQELPSKPKEMSL